MNKFVLPVTLDKSKLVDLYKDVNGDQDQFEWALEVEIFKNINTEYIYYKIQRLTEKLDKVDEQINLMSLVKFCCTGKFIDE